MRRNNLLFLFLCTIGILSAQEKNGAGVNLKDQNYIKADLTVKGNAYIGTLLDSTIQSKLFPQYSLIVGQNHKYLANPDLIDLSTHSSSIISGSGIEIGLISNSIFNGTGSFDDVSAGSLISVSGTGSEVKGVKSSYVFGENNILTNSSTSFVFGDNNKIYQKNGIGNFISGNWNSVSDSIGLSMSSLLGRDNRIYSAGATNTVFSDNIILGRNNTVKSNSFTNNYIIGRNLVLKGDISNSFISGHINDIATSSGEITDVSIVEGINNKILNSTPDLIKYSMILGGFGNTISGARHSYIIGSDDSNINNISDRFGVPEYNNADLNQVIAGGSNNNIKGKSYGSVILGGKGNTIDGNAYSTIIGGINASTVFQGETIIGGFPEPVVATTAPSGNPIGTYAEPTDRIFLLTAPTYIARTNGWHLANQTRVTKRTDIMTVLRDGRVGFNFNYDELMANSQSGINQVLQVNGAAYIKEGITTSSDIYPDYVFEKYFDNYSSTNDKYSFASLSNVEDFIKENKHLPGVTPINKLSKDGDAYIFNLNDLSIQSLEKIEELYLHAIEQHEVIDNQKNKVKELKGQLKLIQESLK